MRKGSFLANFTFLISIAAMVVYFIKYSYMDLSAIASLATVGVASLIILSGSFGGINIIVSMYKSFKHVRKVMYKLYVNDSNSVWEVISAQNFFFKNQYLDCDLTNYKREMERIEEEGMVYTQADIRQYINMDRINAKIKKQYLDSIAYIVKLVAIVGVMVVSYFSIDSIVSFDIFGSYNLGKLDLYVISVIDFIIPILVLVGFVVILMLEYVFFYKTSISKLENEYNLFISDFERYVMPNAKNDMCNNILYLQQLAIQNTKKVVEDEMTSLYANVKDLVVRQGETAKEIDRHVEGVAVVLEKFNSNVDELKINMQDELEYNKISSDNLIKTYKDMFTRFENRLDLMVEEVKNIKVQKVEEVVASETVDTIEEKVEVEETDTIEKKAEAEETDTEEKPKKTTRKRATKKTEESAEVVETEEEKPKKTTRKRATKKAEELAEAEKKKTTTKKRGRKSKVEKEAELKAALEAVVKEADNIGNFVTNKESDEVVDKEKELVEENIVTDVELEEKLVEENQVSSESTQKEVLDAFQGIDEIA
ncbi:MAG: hypothetical protein E7262_01805 [Lachnospiraceae bacterium]|nr:hypothetical protein [Lachnospiraceae bacterium]